MIGRSKMNGRLYDMTPNGMHRQRKKYTKHKILIRLLKLGDRYKKKLFVHNVRGTASIFINC